MSRVSREYIGVIHKEDSSDYGISFPDFPGCISAASSLDELKDMASEALQFHVDGMIEDKQELPSSKDLDSVKSKHPDAEAFLMISVRIPAVAKRINITIDEKLLRKLDKYLEESGDNRSQFFAKSIEDKLSDRL